MPICTLQPAAFPLSSRLSLFNRPLALLCLLMVFETVPGGFGSGAAAQVQLPVPTINSGGVVNAATFRAGVAPGSIASVFGTDLAAGQASANSLPLPSLLANARVGLMAAGQRAAPIFYASPQQMNIQIPWELTGQTPVVMWVEVVTPISPIGYLPGLPVIINLATYAPGIFTVNQSGSGQGAILNGGTGSLAAPAGSVPGARPAIRGGYISIYCTGLGPVTNAPATGSSAPGGEPLARTVAAPTVTIGGQPAPVQFSGLSPGYVGLYQVNAHVPDNAPVGDEVPLVLSIGGAASNTVTLAVQAAGVSVQVSPASASVSAGGTQQFTATVTGTTNTAVTWSVNGITGGNQTVGVISGSGLYTAPATLPSPNTVAVKVTSAADTSKSAQATVTILPGAQPGGVSVQISPANAYLLVGGTQQFAATVSGTTNTAVTWSVNGIAGGNQTVGLISTSGLYTAPSAVPSPPAITARATSVADPSRFAQANVHISAAPPQPAGGILLLSGAPQQATAGSPYSFTFRAAGGTPPYKWRGAMAAPDKESNGLQLDSSTGTLSGTPRFTGRMPLVVTVSDWMGIAMSAQYSLAVGGTGSPRAITNSPPSGTQGSPYAFKFLTSWSATLGCSANLSLIDGNLPPGLTLNNSTGDLGEAPKASGTPLTAGSYTFTVSADAATSLCAPSPRQTNAQTFTVRIAPASSPSSPPGASNWSRTVSDPLLAPASYGWDSFGLASPSVVIVGGRYSMYYEGEDAATRTRQIGLATSPDGITWTKSSANPVVPVGATGSWDSLEVRYPAVHYDGTLFRMWYWGWNGTDAAAQVGLATSLDGVKWTKHPAPVLTGEFYGLGFIPGTVLSAGGRFVMWYGTQYGEIGRATSPDGITWTNAGAVLSVNARLTRPSVVLDGATYRMWFSQRTGAPINNVNIGYASSSDGIGWSVYKQSPSVCFFCSITDEIIPVLAMGAESGWDCPGVGQPSVLKDGSTFKMWYTGGRILVPSFGSLNSTHFVEGAIGYATAP